MLTYEDCVGLTDLNEEEIAAIAEHQHMPEIVAAELGCCLVHDARGESVIEWIIADDIASANRHGHPDEAQHWKQVLDRFCANHSHRMECMAA